MGIPLELKQALKPSFWFCVSGALKFCFLRIKTSKIHVLIQKVLSSQTSFLRVTKYDPLCSTVSEVMSDGIY